jgi:nucleoside-diphosphate-sugar epimerase
VIPQILGRISKREEPFTVYGADESRSFCYIEDAVEAIERVMMSATTDGGTYHIGTSIETQIGELVDQLFTLTGWRPSSIEEQHSLEGSVKRRLPDVSKIKRDTGWEATTSLEAGLKKTIDWYTKHPAPDTSSS